MENLRNYYTALDDQEVLTIAKLKEIINQIPEEELGFEVVCVDKIGEELRGIPVSNVILDVEGKQFTLFNFILRNRLRADAMNVQATQQAQPAQQEGGQ
jgi:hypothetical protein